MSDVLWTGRLTHVDPSDPCEWQVRSDGTEWWRMVEDGPDAKWMRSYSSHGLAAEIALQISETRGDSEVK